MTEITNRFIRTVLLFAVLLVPSLCKLDSRIPVRILTLVPWPNDREHAGWDDGLSLLTAGRLAQNEINDNDNILSDYKIELIARGHEACGLVETTNSTTNLIENAVYPMHFGNVAAVAGLFCSTSTEPVSRTASHRGIDLLQLSASNSPTFRANLDNYPHLWRFLISAEVYAQMMLELMEHFQWNRVALVHDLETIFHSNIGAAFEDLITGHPNYKLVYRSSVIRTFDSFYTQVLESIQKFNVRVIFVAANSPQVAKLLCYASQYNMVYPDYQWVIADYRVSYLRDEEMCDNIILDRATNGSITSFFKIGLNDSEILVSNKTYAEYNQDYEEELNRVRSEYSQYKPIDGDSEYGGLLYDQIWAFALALEAALPELKQRNYSIADYGYGQPDITHLLEDKLAEVDFIGSTGRISFGEYREVSTAIELYQVNGDEDVTFGLCTFSGENLSNTTLSIKRVIHVPDDEIPRVPVLLPDYAIALVGAIIVIVICLVVATQIQIIYFCNTPLVKASSPELSALMFIGCYILCVAAVFNLVTISTTMVSNVVLSVFCNMEVLMAFNGFNLILVTLFVKILRVYRIFNNKRLVHLSRIWKNWRLFLIILAVCICPNIVYVVWLSFDPFVLEQLDFFIYTNGSGLPHYNIVRVCTSTYQAVFYCLIALYLLVFMVAVVYVAARTSRIQQSNFKDTKKVNFFMFLVFLSSFGYAVVTVLLYLSDGRTSNHDNNSGQSTLWAHVSQILGYLTLPFLCVSLLFAPKLLPVLFPSTSKLIETQVTTTITRSQRSLSRKMTQFFPAI